MDRAKFKCSVHLCPKIYSSQGALNKHAKIFHSLTPRVKFKCDLCSNHYSTKSCLKDHIFRIHSGSFTNYGCSLCDAVFKSKSGGDYHVLTTHTGEKAFSCEKCPAKFPTAYHLKCHQLVHSDETPHKCSICSRQFKRRRDLKNHIKNVHSQRKKDFDCSICRKTFYTKSDLSQHDKTHSIGGEIACYFCKNEFSRRSYVDHLRIHTQEKPYFCPDTSCQYSSSYLGNLRSHQRHHHPSIRDQATPLKTWKCYFCSKIHSQSNKLVTHMRSHTQEEPFRCTLCPRSLKSKHHLDYHISTHTKEKPYSCPHCGKCFAQSGHLQTHVATHTGEKRFFCDFCSYSSLQNREMVRHNLARHETNG